MPPSDPAFWYQFLLQILALFFMLVGLLGLVVPVFPGLTVIWLAALAYAILMSVAKLMTGWDWFLFALITLLMAGGNVVDNIIIAQKMRGHEIPWSSILISYAAGILVSLFATPLIGLIASPLALVGAEYLRLRDLKAAVESAKVYMIGWGSAFVVRFGIGFVMIVLWGLWVWL